MNHEAMTNTLRALAGQASVTPYQHVAIAQAIQTIDGLAFTATDLTAKNGVLAHMHTVSTHNTAESIRQNAEHVAENVKLTETNNYYIDEVTRVRQVVSDMVDQRREAGQLNDELSAKNKVLGRDVEALRVIAEHRDNARTECATMLRASRDETLQRDQAIISLTAQRDGRDHTIYALTKDRDKARTIASQRYYQIEQLQREERLRKYAATAPGSRAPRWEYERVCADNDKLRDQLKTADAAAETECNNATIRLHAIMESRDAACIERNNARATAQELQGALTEIRGVAEAIVEGADNVLPLLG